MNKLIVIMVLGLVVACSKDEAIHEEVKTTYTEDTTLNFLAAPNPFDSVIALYFTLTSNDFSTIAVIDPSGKTIYDLPSTSIKIGDNQILLNLSHLGSGVYFVKLTSGNRSIVKRILKI